jgi:hypothetical protein
MNVTHDFTQDRGAVRKNCQYLTDQACWATSGNMSHHKAKLIGLGVLGGVIDCCCCCLLLTVRRCNILRTCHHMQVRTPAHAHARAHAHAPSLSSSGGSGLPSFLSLSRSSLSSCSLDTHTHTALHQVHKSTLNTQIYIHTDIQAGDSRMCRQRTQALKLPLHWCWRACSRALANHCMLQCTR